MRSAEYNRVVDALLVESPALDEIRLASRLPSRAVALLRFRLGRRPNAESLHALGNALGRSATTYAQHNEAYACQEKAWSLSEHPGAALALAVRAEANMDPMGLRAFYAHAAWYLAVRKRWLGTRDVTSEFIYPYERDPHTAAMRGLGNLLVRNQPERAYSYFCMAAEEFADPASVAWLVDGLVYGRYTLPTDPRRALRILLRSVKLYKCPDAAIRAARLLINGCYGVKPRPRKALKLYYRAITSGRADAMCEAANALRRSTSGLSTDFSRAHALYRVAINNSIQSLPSSLSIAQNFTSLSQSTTPSSTTISGTTISTIAHELTTKLIVLPVLDSDKARAQTPDPRATAVQAHFSLAYMLISGMGNVREDQQASASHLLAGIRSGGCWADWWTRERAEITWEPEDSSAARATDALINATEVASSMSELRPLAEMLLVGRGAVHADPHYAVKLFVRALNSEREDDMDSSEPPSPEYNRSLRAIADVLMGTLAVRRNTTEAIKLYTQATESGDILAMRDLAHVLAQGLHGARMNEQRACELWSASSGADTRMPHIATLRAVRDSCNSRGCTQQAVVLYERALESAGLPLNGHTVAMCVDLAHLHRRSNPQRAVQLFRRAVPHNPRAASYLAEMRLWGEDSSPDVEEALRICELASNTDDRSRAMLPYILNRLGGDDSRTVDERNEYIRRARRAINKAFDMDGRPYVHSVIRVLKSREQLPRF